MYGSCVYKQSFAAEFDPKIVTDRPPYVSVSLRNPRLLREKVPSGVMSLQFAGSANSHAALCNIRRHLASFLPSDLLERFWCDGFASTRRPCFRLNTLRMHIRDGKYENDDEANNNIRQLLAGFGLPPDTLVERCPYYPLARLLPASSVAAARVADQAHVLGPLQKGVVYFMGLSSMLPALTLIAHQPTALQSQQQRQQQRRLPPQSYGDSKAGGGAGNSCVGVCAKSGVSGKSKESSGALRVLDLCAAPGGKTALMAELMGNRGMLLAVDPSWPRLQRLHFNIDRLVPNHPNDYRHTNGHGTCDANSDLSCSVTGIDGASGTSATVVAGSKGAWRRGCVVAVHADGARLRVDEHGLPLPHLSGRGVTGCHPRVGRSRYASGGNSAGEEGQADDDGEVGVFDRVLVDAPCSGLGRVQLERPSSYNRWDKSHVERHPDRQRRLLLRGVRLLRPGGSLVYSTCTIDPRENEAVVAWLLVRVGGLRLVEPRLVTPWTPGWSPGPFGSTTVGMDPGSTNVNAHPTSSPLKTTTSLRQALEAHHPGCTYSALLDGTWWDEVTHGVSAGRCDATGKGFSSLQSPNAGNGCADSRSWVARDGTMREWIRSQLEMYCVRVAPGPTYEGFFLAQFVKD
ncbi:hypothetical protein VaNZ11_006996 [Volvox africanus]|uniref:SAM-dependent MTase RsmB/NOP-type domain-containing protein n=1 Tax=Volvox africanus TaxID=51714 RepID=A0ABQ5S360_9CHLO|nr:hypothetical protein VaNZ11_006996 [Volvox africanus]